MPRAKPITKTPPASWREQTPQGSLAATKEQASELMELAVDAAQSRHLPSFLERFVERTARMLGADWCAVMVFRGRETDCYQSAENGDLSGLIRQSHELGKEIEVHRIVTPASEISAVAKSV